MSKIETEKDASTKSTISKFSDSDSSDYGLKDPTKYSTEDEKWFADWRIREKAARDKKS